MKFKKTLRQIFKTNPNNFDPSEPQPDEKEPLSTSLKDNVRRVKKTLGNSPDLIVREIRLGKDGSLPACVFYTDGLANTQSIHDFIMKSLMLDVRQTDLQPHVTSTHNPINLLKSFALTIANVSDVRDFQKLITALLSGHTVVLIDGYAEGFSASTEGWQERGVQEPESQTVVRGPKEGFSENFRTNTALLRRKIKSPNLWLETKTVGRVTKTTVGVMYVKGIANDKVVEEVHERLERIDIDGILESGNIEELIQDETYTPFPTMYNSERPDVIAAGLLEGRVAIIIDGTPFVLLVPALFVQFFHSAEDYYQRADMGTLIRIIRYMSFFISLLAPSFYIAVTTFHQEMLPSSLLFSLAAQREGVPFPAFVEAFVMELVFEILREAGVRLPKAVGQAVSIVGALVIGQAAVEAGLVSPSMVIVVSATAIANFTFPAFNMGISVRILRFTLMIVAASFGLYGILVGLIAMALHLCSLRSFGVPYMSPVAPFVWEDQKDTIFRLPLWAMFSRPSLISQQNNIREQNAPTTKPNPNEYGRDKN